MKKIQRKRDSMHTKITSLKQILKACKGKKGPVDFFIAFGPKGEIRSSKQIWYAGTNKKGQDKLSVFHSIDGSFIRYVGDELLTQTNIGRAIEEGIFYLEEPT